MELSSRTLKAMAESAAKHNLAFVHSLFGPSTGILPCSEFRCEGAFVRKSLEFDVCGCLAVLPSGKMIDVDGKYSLEIGNPENGTWYLAVRFSGREAQFECDCVPMSRPMYEFFLCTLDGLESGEAFPLMRLNVSNGTVSLDPDYMIPCLQLHTEKKYQEVLSGISACADKLWQHQNLAEGPGKTALMRVASKIRSVVPSTRTAVLHGICKDLAQTVGYYVLRPNLEETPQIPELNAFDPQLWFKWLEGYLAKASEVLDSVVLVDDSIDYETLRKELYDSLHESLSAQLEQEMKDRTDALREELMSSVGDALRKFVEEDVRPALHDKLEGELCDELSQKLYPSLYDALYSALYVPEKQVEEVYTPLI